MRLLRKKLFRELRQSKFRFLAISSVVAIGIILFTASYMSFLNLSSSYNYTYEKLHFEDMLVRVERAPERVVERLRALPNIKEVTPRVSEPMGMELEDSTRITGQVIGIPDTKPYVNMLQIRSGNELTGKEKELTCLVETHFAKFNKLGEGDTVYAVKNGQRIPVRIAGVVSSPEYMIVFRNRQFPMTSATVFGVFYFSMDQAKSLLDYSSNSYNEFAFTLNDYSLLSNTEDQVKEILSPFVIEEVTTKDNQISKTILEMDNKQFHDFALFFPILFFTIAAFSIYMILSRMVRTQKPIIGLMRAIGYPARSILRHYLSFALIVGVVGVILGSLLGLVATRLISSLYASQMQIPYVHQGIYPWVFVYGFLIAIGFCALAGFIPARQSAAIEPTEALRGVVDPIKYGKRSWVERLLPSLSRLKVFWRLPLRNVFRNRRRTAFTVVGIIFAVVLIMMTIGINDTVHGTMNKAFKRLFTFDIAVLFLQPQTRVTQSELQQIPGVTMVEPTVGHPCVISSGDKDVESIVMGELADTVMRGFLDESNRVVKITPNHCLMSTTYRDQLGVKTGDTIKISASGRSGTFVISDFIMEPLGAFVYVPVEEARELLGYGQRSSAFYIKVDPGYYEEVRKSLYEVPSVLTLVDLSQIKKEINSYMALLYIVIAVMLVFGLIMAFTLVFNTSTINILEREQEVATMLTLGVPQWKASLSLTLENVLMGLLGLFPGYIAARIVMAQAMKLYSSDLFSFKPIIYPSTYVIVAVLVITIMVLSEFPSLRYIHRLDLAQSTKRRSL
jgi:putative ABC transport system permease protein